MDDPRSFHCETRSQVGIPSKVERLNAEIMLNSKKFKRNTKTFCGDTIYLSETF